MPIKTCVQQSVIIGDSLCCGPVFLGGGGFVSPCSVSVTVEDEDVQKKLRPCQQIVW